MSWKIFVHSLPSTRAKTAKSERLLYLPPKMFGFCLPKCVKKSAKTGLKTHETREPLKIKHFSHYITASYVVKYEEPNERSRSKSAPKPEKILTSSLLASCAPRDDSSKHSRAQVEHSKEAKTRSKKLSKELLARASKPLACFDSQKRRFWRFPREEGTPEKTPKAAQYGSRGLQHAQNALESIFSRFIACSEWLPRGLKRASRARKAQVLSFWSTRRG